MRTLLVSALFMAGCLSDDVDGVELGERDLSIYGGSHWPNGYVDVLYRQYLSGWACIDDYGEPMWVHVYDGSTYLGSTFADHDRPGLEWICGGKIRRGFHWHMPRLASGTHTINVHVNDRPTPSRINQALPGAKQVTFPAPVTGDSPIGYVESITPTRVTGWACDRNVPSSPIDLHVYIQHDGANPPTFLAAGTTSTSRSDVQGLCGSSVAKGFSIPLPPVRGGLHNIVVFGINQGPGVNNALNETASVPNLVDFGCVPPDGTNDSADNLQAVLDGGQDLILCPGATYLLSSTHCGEAGDEAALCLRRSGQMIAGKTPPVGDGPDASAPVLRINGDFSSAIAGIWVGDNLRLRNLVVDGNRSGLGYRQGGALVHLNSSSGVRVSHLKLRGTRSWSTLHVHSQSHGGAEISYNKIEDAGCARSRLGCRAGDPTTPTWADGISFGLPGGGNKIFRNTIENATDGAIVLFAPRDTEVFNNTIRAIDRELLGGINMVDAVNPVTIGGVSYSNFQGVWVHDNVIDAKGKVIDVGIAQGAHTWGCDPAPKLYGATVTRNRFQGAYFRWGAALDWVEGWTFNDNTFTGTFSGAARPSRCGDGGTIPAPRACARAHVVNGTHPGTIQATCTTAATLHTVLHNN